jgi:oxygen-independent coproporphyrinogen-3 oxidase
MAYKPWVAKYSLKMVAEGPLPDFLERKEMMDVIDEKLTAGGYVRVGFESYALPDDPMNKAFNDRTAWYAATGHQPGGRVNYIAVGSSSKVNLGDDYYAQNFYDISAYKKCLDKGKFPIFRGMKLSKDDAIRQHATQHIKSFLGIDFKYFEEYFKINAKDYFKKEIESLDEMIKDGLVTVSDTDIKLTKLGEDFSQNIANVFDKYDPPNKTDAERLAHIEKAKLAQAKVQELI